MQYILGEGGVRTYGGDSKKFYEFVKKPVLVLGEVFAYWVHGIFLLETKHTKKNFSADCL
jgi:hypothetical protein